MALLRLARVAALGAVVAAIAASGTTTSGQTAAAQPTNDAPNPYQSIEGWVKLPEGRTWGSTSAVEIDKDGRVDLGGRTLRRELAVSIAPPARCRTCRRSSSSMRPASSCKSFGAGMLIFPHGIHVDRDGNVWVTDGQDNAQVPQRGARAGGAAAGGAPAGGGRARGEAPTGPIGPRAGATIGNQVFKFSPDGKLLLTLGKAGGAAAPDFFYQPNDVITAANGDIFVVRGARRRQQPRF